MESLDERLLPSLNPISWNSLTGNLILSGSGNDTVTVQPDSIISNQIDVIPGVGSPQAFSAASNAVINIIFNESTGTNSLTIVNLTATPSLGIILTDIGQFGATSSTASQTVSVSEVDGTALALGNVTLSGNLGVFTSGNLSQAANTILAVNGTTGLDAANGAITVDQANTLSGAVALTNAGSNNVTLNNTKALVLGTSNVAAGDLFVSASGNISQAANTSVSVGGTAAFTASNGSISLTQSGNAFNGNVSLTNTGAGNVSLADGVALTLGNISVPTGSLTLTATGNISQPGQHHHNRGQHRQF